MLDERAPPKSTVLRNYSSRLYRRARIAAAATRAFTQSDSQALSVRGDDFRTIFILHSDCWFITRNAARLRKWLTASRIVPFRSDWFVGKREVERLPANLARRTSCCGVV